MSAWGLSLRTREWLRNSLRFIPVKCCSRTSWSRSRCRSTAWPATSVSRRVASMRLCMARVRSPRTLPCGACHTQSAEDPVDAMLRLPHVRDDLCVLSFLAFLQRDPDLRREAITPRRLHEHMPDVTVPRFRDLTVRVEAAKALQARDLGRRRVGGQTASVTDSLCTSSPTKIVAGARSDGTTVRADTDMGWSSDVCDTHDRCRWLWFLQVALGS